MNRNQSENAHDGFAPTDECRRAPVLHDQIAAWVNEGGAGGEVVRTVDAPFGFAVDVIAIQRTA